MLANELLDTIKLLVTDRTRDNQDALESLSVELASSPGVNARSVGMILVHHDPLQLNDRDDSETLYGRLAVSALASLSPSDYSEPAAIYRALRAAISELKFETTTSASSRRLKRAAADIARWETQQSLPHLKPKHVR